jgi:hypothetical protein
MSDNATRTKQNGAGSRRLQPGEGLWVRPEINARRFACDPLGETIDADDSAFLQARGF